MPPAASAPAFVTSLPPTDQAAQELAHAKLVWPLASLPPELQAQGAAIEQRATDVSLRVAKLRWEVGAWLAAGRPAADSEGLQSRTVDVRTAVLHTMVEAGMAVDERMAKLRDAAQERLMTALIETQRAQIALVGGIRRARRCRAVRAAASGGVESGEAGVERCPRLTSTRSSTLS